MNRKTIFAAAFLTAGALAASITGCELIATVDRSLITGTGGAGGATGSSTAEGSSTSTGEGGATSSASGTGGGPACSGVAMACTKELECPDPQNDCVARTCVMGCCGTANVASGVATPSGQTAGDCKKVVCDGAGKTMSADDNLDATDDSNVCTADTCVAGATMHTSIGGACSVGGTVCGDPAGNAAGTCVACNVSADCAGGASCKAHLCVPVGCSNGVKDGAETDQDCGGAACGATCTDGLVCAGNSDCVNDYCKGLICTAPTCTDVATNGNETDTDCGGTGFNGSPACAKCLDTKTCKVSADCASNFCNPSTLKCATPTCGDGFKNGSETGLDCGGATCDGLGKTCGAGLACGSAADCTSGFCQNNTVCALKPNATTCGGATECSSGFCTDGVCCNTLCGGGCNSCNLAGTAGNCAPITPGSSPVTGAGKSTCAASAQASCGNDGKCDGAGACSKWSASTTCRASAGACDVGEGCDGLGACPADGFVAAATVCRAAAAGGCDVAESCTGSSAACPTDAFAGAGVTCSPTSCANGATSTHTCDGATTTCGSTPSGCPGNFVCATATTCKTSCAADADCTSATLYCINPGASGACTAKQPAGATCTNDNECLNGSCLVQDAGFNACN